MTVLGISLPLVTIAMAVALTVYLRCRGRFRRSASSAPSDADHAHRYDGKSLPDDYQRDNASNCRRLNNKLDEFAVAMEVGVTARVQLDVNRNSDPGSKVKDCNKQLARERLKFTPPTATPLKDTPILAELVANGTMARCRCRCPRRAVVVRHND